MERKTILIADNSTINRTLLAGTLKDTYDILLASDGIEALELMREHAESLSAVLLDMVMPLKDGYQVLVEKANDASIATIPVISLSSSAEANTELRALNAGAIDFLAKPVEPEIVRRRVKLAIDQRELESLHIQNRIYEERQYAADHDPLTGIYSKAAFYRETQAMLDANPSANYMLLRFDIEKFKLINSLFGIDMGDHVLTVTAKNLQERMAGRGTYGRYEADNFVACFVQGSMDPEALLNDIGDSVRSSFEDIGLTQTLVLAAGMYPIVERDIAVGEMCDRAAMAMRTTKGEYDRHIATYDDTLRRQLLEEQDILDNMERALENGEFEVYLQPVYSLATENVASAEALVRWNRPGRGIMSPGVFIPLFERNGFISKLDYLMWEQVCQIQTQRAELGLDALPISVNLSRKSLYNPNICTDILELTERYGVAPELFRIEITESAYMDNATQLISTVAQLQEHGFPVLMDDFGSGYSSLNTLREIPVDMLKLDMRFMEGFERGGRVGTIMAAVLRMSKWLGIPVIAEGVETFEEYEFLRTIGCEFTQGFYLARPMPYDDFEDHLARSQGVPPEPAREFSADLVNKVFGADRTETSMFSALFDAMAVYEFSGDDVEVMRGDNGYFDLFGYDASTFGSEGSLLVDRVTPEDYQRILDACHRAVKGEKSARTSIEWPIGSGREVIVSCLKVASDTAANHLVLMGFLRTVISEGDRTYDAGGAKA